MWSSRSALINVKDKETIRQYRVQYPEALSFQNTDPKVSLEYMLMEFKLEDLINKCNTIIEEKQKRWLMGKNSPIIYLK
jgi:hypothetical protein